VLVPQYTSGGWGVGSPPSFQHGHIMAGGSSWQPQRAKGPIIMGLEAWRCAIQAHQHCPRYQHGTASAGALVTGQKRANLDEIFGQKATPLMDLVTPRI